MAHEKEIEMLKLFNEKTEKLKSRTFYQKIFSEKSGFEMSAVLGGPIIKKRIGPDEESIYAFAVTFRPFIKDGDGYSFHELANIYDSLPLSQQLKDAYHGTRKELNRFLDIKSNITYHNETLTHGRILDLVLFGDIIHSNEPKRKFIDRLKEKGWLPKFESLYRS